MNCKVRFAASGGGVHLTGHQLPDAVFENAVRFRRNEQDLPQLHALEMRLAAGCLGRSPVTFFMQTYRLSRICDGFFHMFLTLNTC